MGRLAYSPVVKEDGLEKPQCVTHDEIRPTTMMARSVLRAVPQAVNELYLWYSGFYMAETAPEGGRLHETLATIARVYGHCLNNEPSYSTLYRLDRLDLPTNTTTPGKPITSWSRDHAGARHFYDTFTNDVNRRGTSKWGWRIIRSSEPTPICTFEATVAFLKDVTPELWDWLSKDDMRKSHEVICVTPSPITDLSICETMARLPLGPREKAFFNSPDRLLDRLFNRDTPHPPLGT